MVLPGVELGDIVEVQSHPMALLQCVDFLDAHRWKLVETEDTALSARHIAEHKLRNAAAIAGDLAAELFGLEIVVPDIHSIKNNYTRFLLLRASRFRPGPTKLRSVSRPITSTVR